VVLTFVFQDNDQHRSLVLLKCRISGHFCCFSNNLADRHCTASAVKILIVCVFILPYFRTLLVLIIFTTLHWTVSVVFNALKRIALKRRALKRDPPLQVTRWSARYVNATLCSSWSAPFKTKWLTTETIIFLSGSLQVRPSPVAATFFREYFVLNPFKKNATKRLSDVTASCGATFLTNQRAKSWSVQRSINTGAFHGSVLRTTGPWSSTFSYVVSRYATKTKNARCIWKWCGLTRCPPKKTPLRNRH